MLLFEIGSQEQFDGYLKDLPQDSKCHFMMEKGLSLCNCQFKCRFQGRDRYTLSLGKRIECTRDSVIEIMKMF